MRSALKRIYFALRPPGGFDGFEFELARVFHTEQLFDSLCFQRLLAFCAEYKSLTGARAICTVMSGINPRVQAGCRAHQIDDAALADRMRALAEVADLGYHGHFWFAADQASRPEAEVHCNNFLAASVEQQMDADLEWFARSGLDLHATYAGGWWFQNAAVLTMLAKRGFTLDLSFSKSRWSRNQYSYRLMTQHGICTGEPFRIQTASGDITCVQNLIGGQYSDQLEDFLRNLRNILDPELRHVLAVLNTHDWDLEAENSLRCVDHLQSSLRARFVSLAELRAIASSRIQKQVTA